MFVCSCERAFVHAASPLCVQTGGFLTASFSVPEVRGMWKGERCGRAVRVRWEG